jgi:hypothetical protein
MLRRALHQRTVHVQGPPRVVLRRPRVLQRAVPAQRQVPVADRRRAPTLGVNDCSSTGAGAANDAPAPVIDRRHRLVCLVSVERVVVPPTAGRTIPPRVSAWPDGCPATASESRATPIACNNHETATRTLTAAPPAQRQATHSARAGRAAMGGCRRSVAAALPEPRVTVERPVAPDFDPGPFPEHEGCPIETDQTPSPWRVQTGVGVRHAPSPLAIRNDQRLTEAVMPWQVWAVVARTLGRRDCCESFALVLRRPDPGRAAGRGRAAVSPPTRAR